MNKEKFDDLVFTDAIQNFILKAEHIHDVDSRELVEAITPVADLLWLGRVETVFYQDKEAERRGRGHRTVLYDNGEAAPEPALTSRNVLEPGRIVNYSFYARKGVPEWDEKQCRHLNTLVSVFNVVGWWIVKDKLELYYATHDPTYGIYNGRYIRRKLTEYSRQHILGELGVCRFNVRRMAYINDLFGQEKGTELIQIFLQGLMDLMTDKRELLARLGDDFFAVFRKDHMDAVLGYLSGTTIPVAGIEGDGMQISTWLGVYLMPDEELKAFDIVDATTFSVNMARRNGSEEPVFYDEQVKIQLNRDKRVQVLFEEKIKEDEILVYYQPKVGIKDYKLTGAEALCRWRHEGEMLSPGVFIPALEQGDWICQLDFYMLEHVCRDIRRWLDKGWDPVRVSVNFSRRHFKDKQLLQHIMEIIDRHHVPHKYIEIELTETSTVVGFRDLKALLIGLKKQGIHTSVDDFGTGYSSLNLIRELPWDVLKLDKSFIDLKGQDSGKAQMMFNHVIALAHELGMECITEGVETVEQIGMLKDNNCYLAQGFYFDRPLPVDEFERRLIRKKPSIAVRS